MGDIDKAYRKPTIVLPFMESNGDENVKDLYIYLRPETNGVKVESLLFGVIHNEPLYRDGITLVYLANLPGDFVTVNKVIERHYQLKCEIAKKGRESFTPLMISKFEEWYNIAWDEAEIVSAYDAMRILNLSSKELFDVWVNDRDFLYVHGQTVKKIGNLYVINYDIPELLKKNYVDTDIAVMVLRTGLSNRDLTKLITKMERALKDGGAIAPETPPRRCFHYTKSPLEEILDGRGYLYNEKCEPESFSSISFVSYLMKKGVSVEKIIELVQYPIVEIDEGDEVKEVYLYDYLIGDSYQEAYEKISKIVSVNEAVV